MNAGEGNVIAHNAWWGVQFNAGHGHAVRGNSIHTNGQRGINLGPNDPLPNDLGDADTGPNRKQNYPVIQSITVQGGNTHIAMTLNSVATRYYFLDVYASDSPDGTGYGEGQVYLGTILMRTFGDGNGGATLIVPGTFSGKWITATATRQDTNDTSEFGLAFQAP